MNTVRETLSAYAERAPGGADLLAAVRVRHRRRRRRRFVAGLAAVLVVVGFAAVRPVTEWVDRGQTPASPAPGEQFRMPDFPFTPGWVPPGLGPATVVFDDRGTRLAYPRDIGTPHLSMWVWKAYPSQLEVLAGSVPSSVDINGTSANLWTGPPLDDGWKVLSWQATVGWVVIGADEFIAEADLFRYARSLTLKPIHVHAPFTFARGIKGLVATAVDSEEMMLKRSDGKPGWIEITLEARHDIFNPAETVVVGNHEIVLRQDYENQQAMWMASESWMVGVASTEGLHLDRQSLLDFISGIELTTYAALYGNCC